MYTYETLIDIIKFWEKIIRGTESLEKHFLHFHLLCRNHRKFIYSTIKEMGVHACYTCYLENASTKNTETLEKHYTLLRAINLILFTQPVYQRE